MSTRDLVNAIVAGDAASIEVAFQSVMAEKISDSLESYRQEVAKSMFKTEQVELSEEKHRVQVTVSEPDHPSVSMRKATKQKFIRLSADDEAHAVQKAKAHYKKQGYKVHDAEHVGTIKENVELEEQQLDELDQLALRGMYSTDPKSKQHVGVTTEKGKAARAKANLPVLKQVIARSLGKHPKANLPEEVELDEGWIGGVSKWQSEVEKKHGDVTYKKLTQPGVTGKSTTNALKNGKIVGVYQHHNKSGTVHSVTEDVELDEEQLDELDQLALRGMYSTDPKSKQHIGVTTDKGKAARAKRNLPDLKGAIKASSGKHPKANLPEEAELEEVQIEQLQVSNIESAMYALEEGRGVLDIGLDEAVSSDSKGRYEYSNGKKPSGRGNWMFSTVKPSEHDFKKHADQTVSVQGTFSDAAKKAAAHFKEKGHKGEIHVMP